MKKALFLFSMFLLIGVSKGYSQQPACSNDNGLNARIAAIVNQGFTEIDRQYFQVAYLVAPTPPYLTGTLQVTFVGPFCGIACTPIIRTESFDVKVTNNNGNCVWNVGGNH